MIPPAPGQAPDDAFLDQVPGYHYVYVMSAEPLVIMTLCSTEVPAGAAAAYAPDLLAGRPALHLLHASWTLEHGLPKHFATEIARMQEQLPKSEVLMLCSNEQEVLACAEAGIPAILGNGLIFTDERIWRPVPPVERRRYSAVYNGRLDNFKRHELAARIDDLLLLYNWSLNHDQDDAAALMKVKLPRATFINHGSSGYRALSKTETNGWLAQADIGLCLSAVEGCMRASMEYLLAGLPVVSTHSVGGRERYFNSFYSRIVDPDPDAVAAAVAELRGLDLDRNAIRSHVSQVLAFERHNLLLALNGYIRRKFGVVDDVLTSFRPFLGCISGSVAVRTWRGNMRAQVGQ